MEPGDMKFKACPRCQGDITLCKDYYGMFWSCFQCGWTKDVKADKKQGAAA